MRLPCPWRTRSSQALPCGALPTEPVRPECRRGCAAAWRASLAGKPPGEARHTRPRQRTHAGALCERQ
eukprot:7675029-Alexandrium_andersonii.AAC.1